MKYLITVIIILSLSSTIYCQVLDGGFESGSSSNFWIESSTNFNNIICDFQSCGDYNGLVYPKTGDYFVLLGGEGNQNTFPEVNSIEQSVFIPSGTTATLDFSAYLPLYSSSPIDYGLIFIDGQPKMVISNYDWSMYQNYSNVSINIDTFADSTYHIIKFTGIQNNSIDPFCLVIDDISISVDGQIISKIFEEKFNPNIKVSPNPAGEIVNFYLPNSISSGEISLVDIQGVTVASKKLKFNSPTTFEVSALKNGLYQYSIILQNRIIHGRIVVLH